MCLIQPAVTPTGAFVRVHSDTLPYVRTHTSMYCVANKRNLTSDPTHRRMHVSVPLALPNVLDKHPSASILIHGHLPRDVNSSDNVCVAVAVDVTRSHGKWAVKVDVHRSPDGKDASGCIS